MLTALFRRDGGDHVKLAALLLLAALDVDTLDRASTS
jgi:hypothetical protein